jgi:RNA polymerase sigma factor (sigma-70 family)
MTTSGLAPLVQHLHAFASRQADRSDAELLRAFASRRDEAAFAAIVRRHGGLVLGVCRRALRHEQDAEDAFQATFLVLARNAGAIRKGQSLSSWLHGVAYRVALKARQQSSRRRAGQTRASRPEAGTPRDEVTWAEVRSILDEEVARLPELYREPFVLCCLQGASRAEASERLGVKDGTLSSRLAQGRKRLQEALARRGVALSLAGAAPAVTEHLTRMAVRIASFAAETDGVPAAVSALARGATSTMTWSKTALAAAALLTLFRA